VLVVLAGARRWCPGDPELGALRGGPAPGFRSTLWPRGAGPRSPSLVGTPAPERQMMAQRNPYARDRALVMAFRVASGRQARAP